MKINNNNKKAHSSITIYDTILKQENIQWAMCNAQQNLQYVCLIKPSQGKGQINTASMNLLCNVSNH